MSKVTKENKQKSCFKVSSVKILFLSKHKTCSYRIVLLPIQKTVMTHFNTSSCSRQTGSQIWNRVEMARNIGAALTITFSSCYMLACDPHLCLNKSSESQSQSSSVHGECNSRRILHFPKWQWCKQRVSSSLVIYYIISTTLFHNCFLFWKKKQAITALNSLLCINIMRFHMTDLFQATFKRHSYSFSSLIISVF